MPEAGRETTPATGGAATEKVRAAGCVVLRPEVGTAGSFSVLLIWTDYPDPTLPKGRLEPGERPEDAARREVREETGYYVTIADHDPVTVETLLTAHPPAVRKVIDFYLAYSTRGVAAGSVEAPSTRAAWLPLNEAFRQMRRPEEVLALKKCIEKAGEAGPFSPQPCPMPYGT